MERRKFEDTFKDAFNGAEVEPSDNVWTNLELDLEKEDSTRMKRRLLFYQLVAAASISFAVIMAGVGYYALSSRTAEFTAQNTTVNTNTNTTLSQAKGTSNGNTVGTTGASATAGNTTTGTTFSSQTPDNQSMNSVQQTDTGGASAPYTGGTTSTLPSDNLLAARTETSSTGDGESDNTALSPANSSGLFGPRKPATTQSSSSSENLLATRTETSSTAKRNVAGSVASGQAATRDAGSTTDGGDRSIATQSGESSLALAEQTGNAKTRTAGQTNNTNGKSTTHATTVQAQSNTSSVASLQPKPVQRGVTGVQSGVDGTRVAGRNQAETTNPSDAVNHRTTPVGAGDFGAERVAGVSTSGTRQSATGRNTTSSEGGHVGNGVVSGHGDPVGATPVGTGLIAKNNTGLSQSADQQAAQGIHETTTPESQRSNAVAMHRENAQSSMVPGGSSTMIVGGPNNTATVSQESSIALNSQRQDLPALVQQREMKLVLPKEPEPDPVAQMFARLALREQELRDDGKGRKKKDKKEADDEPTEGEKLWTSAGFAAGSFTNKNSGVTATGSNAGIASNSGVAAQQLNASGASYSVGVGLGKRVTERWVVQGGVNYQTQMYNYTADRAVGDFQNLTFQAVSINTLERADAFDARAQSRVVSTAPYTINNDSRFVSVPVQAGYLLVKKRTGVQLNAGVSTDLFLQNTNGASGDISNTTERLGDNSTYRSVNFSGLMGTEVSYKFGERYRLALSPGVRYAFSSIFKSSTGVQAMPLTFDVGLRFRYIFH